MDNAKFYPYSEEFKEIFGKTRERILDVMPEAEVHHIGSTAVKGLGGKGIVDVLVAIDDWEKKEKAKKALMNLGYTHVHPEENGRIFISREPESVRLW